MEEHILRDEYPLQGEPEMEADNSVTACAAILPIPRVSTQLQGPTKATWHKCLIPAYINGFTYFFYRDQLVAIGKIADIEKSTQRPVVLHFYWILYKPVNQSTWIRGELEEGHLTLDSRWLGPHLTSGHPQAKLGDWTIQILHQQSDGWQYARVCQIIEEANSHLPPGLMIRADWECCLVPQKLFHQKLKPPKF